VPWHSDGFFQVLLARSLDPKATVLLNGRSSGQSNAIAYTRNAGKSRVFYTSLGYPTDFTHAQFLQLLKNAIRWTLD
jgi:type 1 glutamine amidotransferase